MIEDRSLSTDAEAGPNHRHLTRYDLIFRFWEEISDGPALTIGYSEL
jgi:hypothetical protein